MPMGAPEVMGSLTGEGQMGNEEVVIRERDGRFGTDSMGKRGMRGYIVEPEVHPGKIFSFRCYVLELEESVLRYRRAIFWSSSADLSWGRGQMRIRCGSRILLRRSH